MYRQPSKILSPGILPFKVIGTDTDRSGTYEFLLTFPSNLRPILFRFQAIARHWPKSAISHSTKINARAHEGVPLALCSAEWAEKNGIMGLPGREESVIISLAVSIQYMNVLDR